MNFPTVKAASSAPQADRNASATTPMRASEPLTERTRPIFLLPSVLTIFSATSV
jgi:hypothetical protein